MTATQIQEMHERLGDRYLELCAREGILGPMVSWLSDQEGRNTTAFVFWEDAEEPENVDGPRGMLADLVFARVRLRLMCN